MTNKPTSFEGGWPGETARLSARVSELEKINRDWIRDWQAVAEAACEERDIMVTSLRGRIVNMRAAAARAAEYRALLESIVGALPPRLAEDVRAALEKGPLPGDRVAESGSGGL